jgi:hypothetical protein
MKFTIAIKNNFQEHRSNSRKDSFGKLQALPIAHSAGAKPETTWDNQDEAFLAIAQGIRKAVEELQQRKVS